MSDTPETESAPKVERDQVSIQALKGAHAGDTAWIVGKGPTLLMLTKDLLGPGPVIAINEATIAVEALRLENVIYSLQKDADRYEYIPGPTVVAGGIEAIAQLKGATLLVHQHESASRMSEYHPRFVFDNVADFGLEWWEFSSLVAVAIANLMGCPKVVFVSHDACVFGDVRTCTPKPDGSFQVETDTRSATNYPQHRARIEDYASRVSVDVDWLTPCPEDNGRGQGTEALEREVERLSADIEERRASADALAMANAAVRGQLDGALRNLEVVTARLRSAETQSERLALDLEESRAAASVLDAAHAAAQESLGAARSDLQAVTARLVSAEDHVNALLASASWRWTAPLRTVYDLIKTTRAKSRETRT